MVPVPVFVIRNSCLPNPTCVPDYPGFVRVFVTGGLYDLGMFEGLEHTTFDDEIRAVEADRDGADIPAGLDGLPAGPFLAAVLSSICVGDLSGHDRVVVLRARRRMVSHYQAQVYADMASVSDYLEADFAGDLELASDATAAEIRAALRLTRRAADHHQLDLAVTLRDRLPNLWVVFERGDLDGPRVTTIVRGTEHLSESAARTVADLILPDAVDLTTGQIAARLRKLCIEADPDQAASRYDTAVADRHVELRPNPDGTAWLAGYDLPPDRAAHAVDRINRLAQKLRGNGETRTIDQLRADVFLDLLCHGTHPADTGKKPKGSVHITVDLTTLTQLANHAGDLAGYGPVIADIARQTTHQQRNGTWEFVVTDPDTGQPVGVGVTRRRPTAQQKRIIRAHSPHCVMGGCRISAVHADLDHTIDWAKGGPTETFNLDPTCRHDHRIKHQCGWTYTRLPNGHHQWTSRLGHTYTNKPEPP